MSPIRLAAARPVFLIARPLAGVLDPIRLIGAYATLLGLSLTALASQLHGLRRRVAPAQRAGL